MKTDPRVKRIALAAALALAAPLPAPAYEEPPPRSPSAPNLTGLHDFDFLVGEWRAHHVRLKERLAGCHEWVAFDGTSRFRLLMDGWANVDDNVLDLPGGAYRGVTLRAYDPKTGQWAIWWLDSRNPFAELDPPVRGRFVDGTGTFYADDSYRGRPIRVRFIWKRISPASAHWEQAFSRDGGKTWETNWTTDFTRAAP